MEQNQLDLFNQYEQYQDPIFDLIDGGKSFLSTLRPSEWAEKHRIMTKEVSPFPGPFTFNKTPYLKEVLDCMSIDHPARIVAVMKGAQIGFALDVDTLIPTPKGMVKMLDLKVGDNVYDENGESCKVIKATDVMHGHKCYDVHFTDGSVIKADAEHLWTVKDLKNVERTLNTEYISKRFKQTRSNTGRKRNRYYVENAKAIKGREKKLSIEPYLLGLWLGDGSTDGNRITCEKKDLPFYIKELSKRGIKTKSKQYKNYENCYHLFIVDVFNSWKGGSNLYGNKHIPEAYFSASVDQRLSLLQGLIDTDGHVMKDGKVEFYNINEDLIMQVKRLISSLGYKVTIRKRDNSDKYTNIVEGKRYKMQDIYVLNFMGTKELPPSILPRKANRLRYSSDIRQEIHKKWICDVVECDSVPVKCITVDTETHLYLAGESYIPTHNSTGVIENAIGWIIAQNPGNILFLTGDKELSKEAVTGKIDQMIQSCGISHLIRPNVIKKRNQRTGDTASGKEFPGGRLIADSTQNANKLRQRSMRFGFIDDFESAPHSDKKAGSITSLIQMRFASYYDKMKLFYISTPEVKQTSNIEPVFLLGDQRYYHIPCPCCGVQIPLKWNVEKKDKKNKAGIYYKTDEEGRCVPGSVGYICQECGGFFDDRRKDELIAAGEWIPTAIPSQEGYYSYHISALYAPPGMYDWEYYVNEYLKAVPVSGRVDQPVLKAFLNTVLGLTWEERGETPRGMELSKNTRDYERGTIPEELSKSDGNGSIALITCACDLNGKEEDARLDYEIVAWSESGSSYSIDHGSIGTFIPLENSKKVKVERQKWTYEHHQKYSVWPEFKKVLEKRYSFDHGKHDIGINITGIDTGHYGSFAWDFINKTNLLIFGLKGKGLENNPRKLGLDTKTFKKSIDVQLPKLYLVEVNQLKDELADKMKRKWNTAEGAEQPSGFMNFPQPSEGKYTTNNFFSHFASEQKAPAKNTKGEVVGTNWVKRNSRVMNHMWDCRIYNMVMKDIITEIACKEAKINPPSWATYCALILGR